MVRESLLRREPVARRTRRWVAGATAAVLAAGGLALAGPGAAIAITPGSLLASYDFSETSGTVVHDLSGTGHDGTVVGGEAWRGGFMQLNGSNHVKLPDGLLQGESAATIVVETNPTALSGAKFLWNIGGSGNAATGQFFIQPVTPRLAISKTNYTAEQTVTSATKLVEGRWQSVAATIAKNADGATSTMRMYIDGVLVAEKANSTTNLSDLTTHTMNLLGKSAYSGDSLYQGGVSSFRVYDEALTAGELTAVADADATTVGGEVVAAVDLAAVNAQDLSAVETDLVLPTSGGVTWSSSPAGIVGADGKVTRPASDTEVTLTATATVRGKTATRQFTATVLAAPTPAEAAQHAASVLVLPSVLEPGYALPTTALGLPVAWTHVSGAGAIDHGAIASAPESGLVDATLEAVVGTAPDTATARFDVRIAEAQAQRIASYTTSKNTRGGDDPEVTRTAHLALSADGAAYTALNSGAGVVFPEVTGMTETKNGTKRYLANPYLFRLQSDEGFGLIARRVDAAGTADASGALVFTSPDLVHWTELDLLALPGQGTSGAVSAEWDARAATYRVVWTGPTGSALTGTTDDFGSVDYEGAGQQPSGRTGTIGVAYAEPASIIPLTAGEAESAAGLLGRVHNTGLQALDPVTVEAGAELELPEAVTADYSDGGTHDFRVDWDTSAVDTTTPGEYTATGTLQRTDAVYPLASRRADPHMLRYTLPNGDKTWLFISTDDNGQDEFFIRSADTIAGLATAADTRILGIGLSGTAPVGSQLWAPELHVVDGELYLLFAANAENVNAWNGVQSYTMHLRSGGDPRVRADWEAPQRVVDADGLPLTAYGTGITLDMTHFEDDGTDYVVWSERNVPSTGTGPAVLKIAEVAPSTTGPWQLVGERSTIVYPDRGWSDNTTEVVEGPFVIQRDGKVMITFSGSGVDWTYSVGLATAQSGADLLDAASWTVRDYPIWSYEGPTANNWGPGHNSYTYDDDGNLLNVFHAKATQNGSRDAGVRMVYFRQDGSPILDMADTEWLAAANRTVTAKVVVEAAAEPEFTVSAQTRCVAGKVTLVAALANTGEAQVDVLVESSYGTKQLALAAGKTASTPFSTRTAELDAGRLTATVTTTTGGPTLTTTYAADYAARTCG
ncbi:family 43 glycosylhydrolase [Agromyces endophyticus]|uniref:family 43 glycosylhydrolase n=1 Tax=Agromyces sp. H17E-10 TaxID=2932244 RepID=UPI001FD60430|nr:family 43 glycosylhydrolase [Agromyces sp. H17E-10]UOQ90564.1 family 43 glycosylhydrolase [Agromyces sp. H17E-10]